jgi:ferredoxin
MNAKQIKELAYRCGADLCGIAPLDRFEGAPPNMDPRFIMPEAKSMIVMGFRVMRGSLRGIEEGTFFSNYSAMGYGAITYNYIPMTVINICRVIEDEGYEAIPIGHQSDWRGIDNDGHPRERYSKSVDGIKPQPDIMLHLRICAYLAGLGEIGYSKMLLTPEFGPRVRVGIIITELELEPDPIIEPGTLCNRCMACVRECPGGCIPADRTIKANVGGYELEWADVDMRGCNETFIGAERVKEGECGSYIEGREDLKPSSISPFYHKQKNLYNSGKAICGAAGCTRACMISLEKRGLLKNKFEHPFRTEKPWRVDWSAEEIKVDYKCAYDDYKDSPNYRKKDKSDTD